MTAPDNANPDFDLSEWRAAIDKHDDDILALIKSRLALSEQVGRSKARGGLPWRPAREAQLFARLVRCAGTTLSPQAVERLWSTVIAQSLQAQGPAFLLVSRSQPNLPYLARTFFGLLPLELVANDAQAIARCAKEEGAIAIVPTPAERTKWWTDLVKLNAGKTQAPAVLAALPRFARTSPPTAYAIANAPREKTGNDIQWLATNAKHVNAISGPVLTRVNDLSLVAASGDFVVPEGVPFCQIGLFAKPLSQS